MTEHTLELGGPVYELESVGVQGPAGADGDGAGGGGASTFLDLTDTPESYTASQLLAANGDATGLVHVDGATARSLLGLGTAALAATGDFATAAQGVLAGTAVQPGDLATVATSGAYADLSGLPTLFSGAYGDLSGVPSTFAPSAHTIQSHSNVTGSMAENTHLRSDGTSWIISSILTDVQWAVAQTSISTLSDVTVFEPAAGQVTRFNGTAWVNAVLAYSDLSGTPSLATVATSGDYNDLANLPTLFSGAYGDLTGVPSTFAPAAHTLQSHSDVSATAPSADQTVLWDAIGSIWRPTSLNTGHIKSGTFANARISQSSVTQHQAALAIAGSQVSGKAGPGAAFDGGGAAITSGVVVRAPVTEAGTVTACYADADQSGSIDVIVRRYAAADTSFASPTTLGTLSISSAQKGSLTGLSQAVAVGDTIEFETSGTIATIERLAVRTRI